MDELLYRLGNVICELDEIADELDMEYSINPRPLMDASDMVNEFEKKLSKMLEREDDIPDLYHIKLQEKLEAESRGEWVKW